MCGAPCGSDGREGSTTSDAERGRGKGTGALAGAGGAPRAAAAAPAPACASAAPAGAAWAAGVAGRASGRVRVWVRISVCMGLPTAASPAAPPLRSFSSSMKRFRCGSTCARPQHPQRQARQACAFQVAQDRAYAS